MFIRQLWYSQLVLSRSDHAGRKRCDRERERKRDKKGKIEGAEGPHISYGVKARGSESPKPVCDACCVYQRGNHERSRGLSRKLRKDSFLFFAQHIMLLLILSCFIFTIRVSSFFIVSTSLSISFSLVVKLYVIRNLLRIS